MKKNILILVLGLAGGAAVGIYGGIKITIYSIKRYFESGKFEVQLDEEFNKRYGY